MYESATLSPFSVNIENRSSELITGPETVHEQNALLSSPDFHDNWIGTCIDLSFYIS
jgi:hypothetical protein